MWWSLTPGTVLNPLIHFRNDKLSDFRSIFIGICESEKDSFRIQYPCMKSIIKHHKISGRFTGNEFLLLEKLQDQKYGSRIVIKVENNNCSFQR